jgi:hypothetical protein
MQKVSSFLLLLLFCNKEFFNFNNIGTKEKPKNIPVVCILELIKAVYMASSIDGYIIPSTGRLIRLSKLK